MPGIPDPERQLLAVDKMGCSLLFVRPDGAITHRLPMPRGPHEIVLNPQKTHAFISIYGTGTFRDNPDPGFEIEVVRLADGFLTGSLDLSPWTSPHGLTFDHNGLLWTSCDRHGLVLAISPADRNVIATVETGSFGTHWVLATPDGSKLFTANKHDPFVSVIDPFPKRMTGHIPVPHGTEGLAFSPDGRWLFAADHRVPQVLRIDVAREEVVEVIALLGLAPIPAQAAHHMRLSVSPDATVLCVAAYHYDRLILVDLANPAQQTIVPTGRGPMAMAFDPANPHHLYLSNHDEGTVSVVELNEPAILRTFACGCGVESMLFFGAF